VNPDQLRDPNRQWMLG